MKEKINIYYDEEGDFLEITMGKPTKGHFKNLGDGIFKRIDEKTNKVKGFMIHSFKKRTEKDKEIKFTLPVKMQLS